MVIVLPRSRSRGSAQTSRPENDRKAAAASKVVSRSKLPLTERQREAIRRWMESDIEFVSHPDFARTAPADASATAGGSKLAPLPQLADGELLTPQQERELFFRMNLLKFQANRLREKLSFSAEAPTIVRRLESLLQQAAEARNVLIRANLRLVSSVAKKFASARHPFAELVSDGNLTLFRAVEKFDCSRGFRFSTYATWAMQYNFARAVSGKKPHVGLLGRDEDGLPDVIDHRRSPAEHQTALGRHRALGKMLAKLDDRERTVITRRYGLEADREELSLQELADEMSICKERVRQLQMRALDKLRDLAQVEHLEPPDEV